MKRYFMVLNFLTILFGSCVGDGKVVFKRALQRSHEKPRADKYMDAFFGKTADFDQTQSLVSLIAMISQSYLTNCSPVILYDYVVENSDLLLLEQLFRESSRIPIDFTHGQITSKYRLSNTKMLNSFNNKCLSYIIFMTDVMKLQQVIGKQNINRVVVIAKSSQWRVHEFLGSDYAQSFVNLLVVSQSERVPLYGEELPYILYTHELYIDALGSSTPKVLTSWKNMNLTRPSVNLFPSKMENGFAGHRFIVSLADQPPFVIYRGEDENTNIRWDGIEVKLVSLLADLYNFTIEFKLAKDAERLSSGDAVVLEVTKKKANLGIAGLYTTSDRIDIVDVAWSHYQDCAAFISLTSTALPKYRAIMGPFHWTVWLAVTFTYLFAIFPISFSDNHSLHHLLKQPEEMENMFWYVFGTFTNCFTFTGAHSWNKSQKVATRLLIGFYWIFTIITTACYTGSIIAFVTIPVYPITVDTVKQLVSGRYQVGTLDRGGWERWFWNSSDSYTERLFNKIEFLSNVESGLRNTTKAFFWPYAFLGSRAELDYIVRTNFTTSSKRSLLHISSECFVPFGVSLMFPRNSLYTQLLNRGIMRAVQSGFLTKFFHDVEWNIMRSSTGKLLQANAGFSLKTWTVEDRALTLDDTQGMFLLLSLGFVIGGSFFLSEWLGGCWNFCKARRNRSAISIESNPRSHDAPTPREKLDSIQFTNPPLEKICDNEHEHENENELNDVSGKICVAVEMNHNELHENFVGNAVDSAQENADAEEINDEPVADVDYIISEVERIFNFEEVFGTDNQSNTVADEEIDTN